MTGRDDVIRQVTQFVKESVEGYDSGHGWAHIERVVRLALHIRDAENEGDSFVVELGALLHDVGDHKFGLHDGPAEIRKLLSGLGIDGDVIDKVVFINLNVSFSKGARDKDGGPEFRAVQDADRLDAMGAVGIARAFSYGGFRQREIYDPRDRLMNPATPSAAGPKPSSTVGHFYEKLLLLKDLMNTQEGKRLAAERHEFMERYLDRFYREWNGEL